MSHPLFGMLALAVPLRIMDLERAGGPTDRAFARCGAFGQVLAEKGDVLLFGGKPGEAGALFNELGYCVAVLSFCPGGVRVGGSVYVGKGVSGAEIARGRDPGLIAFLSRLHSKDG